MMYIFRYLKYYLGDEIGDHRHSFQCMRGLRNGIRDPSCSYPPSIWIQNVNPIKLLLYGREILYCVAIYLKHYVCLTVRTREWDGSHEEFIFCWNDYHWCLYFTRSCPCSLECLRCTITIFLCVSCMTVLTITDFLNNTVGVGVCGTVYNSCWIREFVTQPNCHNGNQFFFSLCGPHINMLWFVLVSFIFLYL